MAAKLDYDVTTVYCDNSISAFSGAHRPSYEAMLEAVRHGQVNAVIVWHQDRLLRRNTDLETYINACDPHAVPTHTVKAGLVDLSTPAGRAIARTLAASSTYEVDTSTARVKAAKLQQAKSGSWSGGQRPFGYEPGLTAIRKSEAAIVRQAIGRVIAGASFRSIALDLNARGITTQNGKLWNALTVRNLLSKPMYAGLRQHHDDLYPAQWPAIIDQATYKQGSAQSLVDT